MFLFSNERKALYNINYDSWQIVDGLKLNHSHPTIVLKLSMNEPANIALRHTMSDILKQILIYPRYKKIDSRAVFEGTTTTGFVLKRFLVKKSFTKTARCQNSSPFRSQPQLIKYYETTKQSKILDTSVVITHGVIVVDLTLSIL
uniref:Uncharacterized protein n=1 Tax=Glossina austeni TaxID=7395 RepID=A0A1A9VMA6_GLOAU